MTSKESFNDQEAIKYILHGTPRERSMVFRFLYKQQYPQVVHLLKAKGGTESQIADIFQDALVIFYNQVRAEKFKGNGSLSNYLKSITKHLWYRTFRKLDSLVYANELNGHNEQEIELNEEYDRYLLLQDALEELGDPCREVLMDFYYAGASIKDIQHKFGLGSEQAAKNKKYRCLQKLTKLIKSKKVDPKADSRNEIASRF